MLGSHSIGSFVVAQVRRSSPSHLAHRSLHGTKPLHDRTNILCGTTTGVSMKSHLFVVGLLRTVSAFAASEPRSSLFGHRPTLLPSSTSHKTTRTALFSYGNRQPHRNDLDDQYTRHASSNNQNYYYSTDASPYYSRNLNAGDDPSSSTPSEPLLTLRLARRSDVSSMQRCNLATLPENYDEQFYVTHLQQWPELALVVVMEDGTQDHDARGKRQSSMSSRWTGGSLGSTTSDKVVAYVLGKIEERPVPVTETVDSHYHLDGYGDDYFYPSPQQDTRWYEGTTSHNKHAQSIGRRARTATIPYGHVTSLAVLDSFRRRGLAHSLMQQLHAHMAWYYGDRIQRVGLHVRAGNAPATRLYGNVLGYRVMERIPQYYQDGEDGLLMEMDLSRQPPKQGSSSSTLLGNLWGRRSRWGNRNEDSVYDDQTGIPDLRLPRVVGIASQNFQREQHRDERDEPLHLRY